MYLVKSCASEFNVLKCNTILVGSLDYYRNTFEKEIADEHEGTIDFQFDLKNFHMCPDLHSALHRVNNSRGEANIEVMTYGDISPIFHNHIFFKRYISEFKLKQENRFAFCISKQFSPTASMGMFNKYDDYWYFNTDRVPMIANAMSLEILKKIKRLIIEGVSVFTTPVNLEALSVQWSTNDIKYTNRQVFIDNRHLYSNATEIAYYINNSHFLKPIQFEKEKEARFVFDILSEGKVLIPKLEHLVIDANSFLPLLK